MGKTKLVVDLGQEQRFTGLTKTQTILLKQFIDLNTLKKNKVLIVMLQLVKKCETIRINVIDNMAALRSPHCSTIQLLKD